MVAEPTRGPGRPAVDPEERKVTFTASVRMSTVNLVDYVIESTGETKGELVERLIRGEYARVNDKLAEGIYYFRDWLRLTGAQDVIIGNDDVYSGEQIATAFDSDGLVVHATDRALYRLALSTDRAAQMKQANEVVHDMRRFGTRLARFDIIDGTLNFATPESVAQAIEALKNQSVRLWPIGEHEPSVGTLRHVANNVYLEPLEDRPAIRNGTGLIPKLNVIRVEPLESNALYAMHLAGAPGVSDSFTLTVDPETMTWVTLPPGGQIDKPITGRFSRGGPIGSGKYFTVYPDGRAVEVRN